MVAVLHVSQPTDGGVGRYVGALCADQRARGWNVAVACPPGTHLATGLAAAGVAHHAWHAERGIGASIGRETHRLGRLIRDVAPDVIHLHSSKAGLAGRLAVRGRLPTIFQPHGWSWLAARRGMAWAVTAGERALANWTTLYVCVGRGEAAHATARGIAGRYSVVHSGVDLGHFQPGGERGRRVARHRLGIAPDTPLVVCVGRVTRQKGQDRLLAAWPDVRARRADATLALVGGGDLLAPMREQETPGVIFAGATEDTRSWYAAADLIVLPSRWEGMPLTMLEALAVGRPVVGTAIPGIADSLPAGCGAVVPPDDLAALAEAIAYRVNRPDVARTEGANGARYAAVRADIRRTHERLATITARISYLHRRRTAAGRLAWTRG